MIATLGTLTFVLFALCILAVCAFEFVNGFHDTANAVATVIYTGTLKPVHAVIWSGMWNFLGVFAGGVGVAMGIVKLLPLADMMGNSDIENILMVFSILLSAIAWNIGTWYYGIPCSSSHTLIGSLIGAGIAFHYLHPMSDGVNWSKAGEIMMSLLLSPGMGFLLAIGLMFISRNLLKSNSEIFEEPKDGQKPPIWIRAILVTTCTLVSFFHGSNDGQKGVGLMMVILLIFLPTEYALSDKFEISACTAKVASIEAKVTPLGSADLLKEVTELKGKLADLEANKNAKTFFAVRKKMQKLVKDVDKFPLKGNATDIKAAKKEISGLKEYTDFAPPWIIALIAISLGLGTMIGWKRIVVTIGEKIGKSHLTYAEGAIAEVIASISLGLSTNFGLPVSTTHVLSSGVAGAMTASGGVKNLQADTIKNIGIAWILTLPVTIALSGGLYMLFSLFV
jgi:PiT family inorganic phosphate transporter